MKIFMILLFVASTIVSYSQSKYKVDLDRRKIKNGYEITCVNNTNQTRTVRVDFSVLFNYKIQGGRNPFFKSVRPGKSTLFKLIKSHEIGTADFRYTSSSIAGKLSYKSKHEPIYMLPLMPNKSAKLVRSTYLAQSLGLKEEPDNWDTHYFYIPAGDTLTCSRMGRVIKVKQAYNEGELTDENTYFDARKNYIRVEHKDGTIARYKGFAQDGIFVNEGDEIFVGTPLGTVGERPHKQSGISFMVYYYDLSEWQKNKTKKAIIKYQNLKFHTKEQQGTLDDKSVFTYEFNKELVLKEMSRKEKKKWKKSFEKKKP